MTQQVAHVKVTLPSVAGDVELDNCSFSLTIEATGSDTGLDFSDVETPGTAITTFLNTATGPQTHPIAFYLSPDLDRTANVCTISYTDVTAHLDGSPAGTPFRTDTFTLGASDSASALPGQLSFCLAYRADYSTDLEHGGTTALPSSDSAIDQGAPATHMGVTRPRARDRARMYIGPVNANHPISGVRGQPDATCIADLGYALNGLLDTKNALSHNQFNVVVWSRRAQTVKIADWYYINTELCTQRRRWDTTQARVHNWTART